MLERIFGAQTCRAVDLAMVNAICWSKLRSLSAGVSLSPLPKPKFSKL
jgi:hypothetical protein